MKNVLIIANLKHSYPRITGIAAYLNEFGWQPTIVTVPVDVDKLGVPERFKDNVIVSEAKYRGDMFWFARIVLKKLGFTDQESMIEQMKSHARTNKPKKLIEYIAHLAHDLLAYPDPEFTWQKPAIKHINEVIKDDSHETYRDDIVYNAILSSSPHPTTQIVASKIAQKHKIPWVADFRDSWVANHYYVHNPIRKWFETRLEKKTIKPCSYIIAATPMILDKQKELHNKPTSVIYNGFDEGTLNIPAVGLAKNFTITYTGTIYQYKQDPEKFLKALRKVWESYSDPFYVDFYNNVEVRFYGQKYGWFQDLIDEYGLEDIVKQYGKISRAEVVRRQQESHVLLTFNWEDANEKGVCPLKFFEYLAAQRPILATGGIPVDAVQTLIERTQSGVYCHSVESIERELKRLYNNYLQSKNGFLSNEREVLKFSYREEAKQFAKVLDEVIE